MLIEIAMVAAGIGLMGAMQRLLDPGRRVRKALARMDSRPIRDAVEGKLVKICGVVQAIDEPLVAPLSGRVCAAYQITERPVHEVVMLQECIDFVVRDATGAIRIDSRVVALALEIDVSKPKATKALQSRLKQAGPLAPDSVGYSEAVLAEGARVVVMGRAQEEVDPDLSNWDDYRESPRRLVLIPPAKKTAVLIESKAER